MLSLLTGSAEGRAAIRSMRNLEYFKTGVALAVLAAVVGIGAELEGYTNFTDAI